MSESIFIKYRLLDGYVVEVSRERPALPLPGYGVAEVEMPEFADHHFEPGDELKYFIIVNNVNEDGFLTAYTRYPQIPPVRDVLARTMDLERASGVRGGSGEFGISQRLDDLEMAIAALLGGEGGQGS